MSRLFRKYHRSFAIVCALPLLLTVITGMSYPIANGLNQHELGEFLIHLHTLETFGLAGFFPIINGLGLLGLLITGISMINRVRKQRPASDLTEL